MQFSNAVTKNSYLSLYTLSHCQLAELLHRNEACSQLTAKPVPDIYILWLLSYKTTRSKNIAPVVQ